MLELAVIPVEEAGKSVAEESVASAGRIIGGVPKVHQCLLYPIAILITREFQSHGEADTPLCRFGPLASR